jgi:hypothetical protein
MSLDTLAYHATWAAVYVAVPFWFIVGRRIWSSSSSVTPRSVGRGILLSTLIMWPLMILHRTSIEVPYIMARTIDPMYDGVGGNAAILVMGWCMALVFQLPHITLRLLLDAFRRKRRESQIT